MFIAITHKNASEPRETVRLALERKQFELLFDTMGIKYEYWGYTIPVNSMRKMNRWKILPAHDSNVGEQTGGLEINDSFLCYLSE